MILRIATGVLRRLINIVVNQTSALFLAIDMALSGIECLPLRLLSDAVLTRSNAVAKSPLSDIRPVILALDLGVERSLIHRLLRGVLQKYNRIALSKSASGPSEPSTIQFT